MNSLWVVCEFRSRGVRVVDRRCGRGLLPAAEEHVHAGTAGAEDDQDQREGGEGHGVLDAVRCLPQPVVPPHPGDDHHLLGDDEGRDDRGEQAEDQQRPSDHLEHGGSPGEQLRLRQPVLLQGVHGRADAMGEALPAMGDEHEPQRQPRHQQADVLYHIDERLHGTLLRRTTPYWLECRTGSATSCGCREGAYVSQELISTESRMARRVRGVFSRARTSSDVSSREPSVPTAMTVRGVSVSGRSNALRTASRSKPPIWCVARSSAWAWTVK